jgi:TPR repeat protein
VLLTIFSFSCATTKNKDIHLAAERGQLGKVQELLRDDPEDINAQNDSGKTPLYLAIEKGQRDVAELLINRGADLNCVDQDGFTLLHRAAESGDIKVAKLLIRKGADVNSVSPVGLTPIYFAFDREMAELLSRTGADINVRTEFGVTPLEWAVRSGANETAELLAPRIRGGSVSSEARKHLDRGSAVARLAESKEGYNDAISEFKEAIRLAPGWAAAYCNLGMIQDKAEDYTSAMVNLKLYLLLEPNADDAASVRSLINGIDYKRDKDNPNNARFAHNDRARAFNFLGNLYDNGEGVAKDYKKAFACYHKAAEQGYPPSQVSVGYMYSSGEGVPQDHSEAVKWYRKAAEQGDAKGQYNLGVCYVHGYGVDENAVEAIGWYRKAAEQGYANAQFSLGLGYDNGEGVPRNYSEAVKWYRKAAEQGNANAMNNLGTCYYTGRGVPKDNMQAAKWLRKAAEGGASWAESNLKILGL